MQKNENIFFRYNIIDAQIERYIIPEENMQAYKNARSKQDLNAHIKYGIQIISKAN